MPRRSRTGLRTPSAATRYRARTVSSLPSARFTDDRQDAVVAALERGQLLAPFDRGAELLRAAVQERLEADLCHEQSSRRAQVLDALVDVAEVVLELLAAEALDRDDRAVLDEFALRGGDDLVLEADGAVELDRALVEERGARVDRSAGMPLDDERLDAVPAQEEPRREPDEAPADDQNGDFAVGHRPDTTACDLPRSKLGRQRPERARPSIDTVRRVSSTPRACADSQSWLRSQTMRRPSSVSSGSSLPIVFECGAISSARPPVATTCASTPSSPRIAATMPSTWPAKP